MLFRNCLLSPSLGAGILNGKYSNAVAYHRIEKEMSNFGVNVTRREMARWTIMMSERYLSMLYEALHRELYEYQKTRKADHPREFLKDYNGICVTDGYQVYHMIEKEREGLKIAGCWAHARQRYDEAVKAMPEEDRKKSVANKALSMIRAISTEEGRLKDISPSERLEQRQLTVKPLVEAYFEWVRENEGRVLRDSKTHKGFVYSLNQERYLKAFLDDGEVPMTNNAAERAIRPFCLGKKNWVFYDTISGAEASAVAYSISETAKANGLKVYEYFRHLLTVIPEHMEDTSTEFMHDLLPWSDKLPEFAGNKKATSDGAAQFSWVTRYGAFTNNEFEPASNAFAME